MLKKVIGAIRSWLQKYSITTTINKFDEKLDHTSWKGAEFYPNYFQPFALVPPSNYSSQGTYRQIKIDDKLGEVAANITEDFKDKLVSLLGDNVRLDDIYLFWYDPEKRTEWSLSNSWHDDNVGHRIKIFVCFEGNGTTPTVVIPNSFNKPYKMRNSEYKRFLGGETLMLFKMKLSSHIKQVILLSLIRLAYIEVYMKSLLLYVLSWLWNTLTEIKQILLQVNLHVDQE